MVRGGTLRFELETVVRRSPAPLKYMRSSCNDAYVLGRCSLCTRQFVRLRTTTQYRTMVWRSFSFQLTGTRAGLTPGPGYHNCRDSTLPGPARPGRNRQTHVTLIVTPYLHSRCQMKSGTVFFSSSNQHPVAIFSSCFNVAVYQLRLSWQ